MRLRLVLALLLAGCWTIPSAAQENIARDWDGDGIPNSQDTCPNIPAAGDGVDEALFCGPGLQKIIDDYVFLWSRTFRVPETIDPALRARKGAFHAFLHIAARRDRAALTTRQREILSRAGVSLLGYLPHRTWYARFASPSAVQEIGSLAFVSGISAIMPQDRLDPLLRLEQGPIEGKNKDGSYTLSVTFFGENISVLARGALRAIGAEILIEDGNEAHIRVNGDEGLKALASVDEVETITDIAGPPGVKTDNGRTLAQVDPVDTNFNLFGSGLTIAMAEPGVVPFGHPDLDPRVTRLSFFPAGSGLITLTAPDALQLNKVVSQYVGYWHAQNVASIIAGSGATLPGFRGLLPSVQLLSYSVLAPLNKQRFYRNGQDARVNHAAVAINHSWGPQNLNRPGMYLNRGRWLDRVVRWHDMPVIWASGNERCGPDCANTPLNLVPSLPHPVAKNDIAVGNVNANTGVISASSSSGPAADGRLKPDIVAPGTGLQTVTMNPLRSPSFFADTFGGTSAAAPFVTGVVGMMTERFIRDGRPASMVLPALIKAILLETADDIGAPGPDFFNGYGLINAREAIRAVRDPSRIIEGAVQISDGPVSFSIDVDQPRTDLSATLVWTDIPGQTASTLTLINDLDLTIRSPSGTVFRSFNLMSPPASPGAVGLGTAPCTNSGCTDVLNTVEQVLVDTGDLLDVGTWTITVTPSRVIPIFPNVPRQDFAIAVSAACPVIIASDTTLTGNINCPFDPLAPEVVRVVNSNVTLDCNGFTISGSGFQVGGFPGQTGISVEASNTIVQNCNVEQVRTGIGVMPGANGVQLVGNTLTDTRASAIDLQGQRTFVTGNELRRVHGANGAAIRVRGGASRIFDNTILPHPGGQGPGSDIGIDWDAPVNTGSGNGFIRDNTINGANFGVIIAGDANTVTGLEVTDNSFEGTRMDAITVRGDVARTIIGENTIQGFGRNRHAITVMGGSGHLIRGNTIIAGMPFQGSKTCISVETSRETNIQGNTLTACGTAVADRQNTATAILENSVSTTGLGPLTRFGIASSDSQAPQAREHIARNSITFTSVGIQLRGETDARVEANVLTDLPTGITVRTGPNLQVQMGGNAIDVGGLGIMLASGRALIVDNMLQDTAAPGQNPGTGVSLGSSSCRPTDGIRFSGNRFEALEVGLLIRCDTTQLSVIGNTFRDSDAAIRQDGSAQISGFELTGNIFEANQSHVLFTSPVVGAENIWDDINSLRIYDSDGDGYGDCGIDYPYTSSGFTGPGNASAVSTRSNQVQDIRPVTSATPTGC